MLTLRVVLQCLPCRFAWKEQTGPMTENALQEKPSNTLQIWCISLTSGVASSTAHHRPPLGASPSICGIRHLPAPARNTAAVLDFQHGSLSTSEVGAQIRAVEISFLHQASV